MIDLKYRPVEVWPGPRTTERRESQFKASWNTTLDQLEYELKRLRASDIVIQREDVILSDIRNDGQIRGTHREDKTRPGVILAFSSPKGSLSFPCDRYTSWRDNVRAIALALEALRAVDRYGVTRGNEQYTGWARLEAPANGKMSREAAAAVIAGVVGADPNVLLKSWEQIGVAMVRRAMVLSSPDSATDDADRARRHELFVKVGEAGRVLTQ
jgi:hypothetical protein